MQVLPSVHDQDEPSPVHRRGESAHAMAVEWFLLRLQMRRPHSISSLRLLGLFGLPLQHNLLTHAVTRTRTSLIMQQTPSCVPWGVMMAFLIDYLAQDRHFGELCECHLQPSALLPDHSRLSLSLLVYAPRGGFGNSGSFCDWRRRRHWRWHWRRCRAGTTGIMRAYTRLCACNSCLVDVTAVVWCVPHLRTCVWLRS